MKISAKTAVFLISNGQKQISPLFAPVENFWKNPLVPPQEKLLTTPMIRTSL